MQPVLAFQHSAPAGGRRRQCRRPEAAVPPTLRPPPCWPSLPTRPRPCFEHLVPVGTVSREPPHAAARPSGLAASARLRFPPARVGHGVRTVATRFTSGSERSGFNQSHQRPPRCSSAAATAGCPALTRSTSWIGLAAEGPEAPSGRQRGCRRGAEARAGPFRAFAKHGQKQRRAKGPPPSPRSPLEGRKWPPWPHVMAWAAGGL